MSKVVRQQHTGTGAHKVRLREALLTTLGEGAAYVPFVGDGDIAAALYTDRVIHGIDIDPDRIATAKARLPDANLIIADCEEGWPLTTSDTFAICDADAYTYPYGAIRAFLANANLADRIALFGTDGQMMYGNQMQHRWHHPDGHWVDVAKAKTMTIRLYWPRAIKPWLEAAIPQAGYRITAMRKTWRVQYGNGMLYWGILAERL